MKTLNELQKFTLQLSLAKGVGPVLFKKILQDNGGVVGACNNHEIANLARLVNIDNILDMLYRKSIGVVCLWDDDYPLNLKNIPDSPPIIFYKGNLALLKTENNFSIVGSRRMTNYGKRYCHKIIEGFKGLEFNIVSGLATGVDSIAHACAIKNCIPTIAVLASSVDIPTPSYNTYLYKEILASGGLIISEVLPGEILVPGFFPRRNRIIAGLSKGTLIVEAGERSGALITANLSFGYDRPVFAIPGNLDSIYSVGSNMLIKENKARLVQDINDILSELSIDYKSPEAVRLINLTDLELQIFNFLKDKPRFVEEVANFFKIEFSVIISSCSIMELNGYISKNEKGEYYLN